MLLISPEFASSEFIMEYELPLIQEEFKNDRIKIIPLLIIQVSHLLNS
jgi:hypothetical protein